MHPELIPTEAQRLAFARELYRMGRLHDGRAPTLVCRACHRPWAVPPLDYARAAEIAEADGWVPLFLRHAPCGTLQAIPRATGGR